ncbi:retrovirus-related pol polyprotein from transposon TNT 1-94 [Tanacetum coccineum]
MQGTSLRNKKESSSQRLFSTISITQLELCFTVNQQLEFPQLDSGLIVPVFQKGDDPIDAINHMMSFLTVVVTSRYPTTNNQLRNSSNPRQQTTIRASGSNSGKQRTVICYNYKGEGHMSKQCTKPKRKRDDSWFKDKVLLVQAQASGQILHEEELAFLADPGIPEGVRLHNQSEMLRSCQNSNSSAQQDALILSVIEQLKTQVINCTKINLDNKSVNDTLTAELERYRNKKPGNLKQIFIVSKPKVIKSVSANKKEPIISWGSIVSDVPSSSLDKCRSPKLFSVKFGNDHVAKILGYGDYQIGNVTILRVTMWKDLDTTYSPLGNFINQTLKLLFVNTHASFDNLEGVDLYWIMRQTICYTLSLRDMLASISYMSSCQRPQRLSPALTTVRLFI